MLFHVNCSVNYPGNIRSESKYSSDWSALIAANGIASFSSKEHKGHPEEIEEIRSFPESQVELFKEELLVVDRVPSSPSTYRSDDFKDSWQYAAYMDERNRRRNYEDESRGRIERLESIVSKQQQDFKSLTEKIDGMANWMSQPCLLTAIEVMWKDFFKITSDEKLNLKNDVKERSHQEILTATKVQKEHWFNAVDFFYKQIPTRNQIIHNNRPGNDLVSHSFSYLEKFMNEEEKVSFKKILGPI